jgi:hypothetical protein
MFLFSRTKLPHNVDISLELHSCHLKSMRHLWPHYKYITIANDIISDAKNCGVNLGA